MLEKIPRAVGRRFEGVRAGADYRFRAVPLTNGETVVGVFGLIDGGPTTRPRSHRRISRPVRSRCFVSWSRPLDEADCGRAPSEHRDGQKPRPASLQRARRQHPARGRRRRAFRIARLIGAQSES